MKIFLQKITSRKFIAALAGLFTGLAIVLGADQDAVSTVSGAVVSLASLVSYIVAEGSIDAAAVKKESGDDGE